MHLRLATRFYAAIVAVVALSVVTGVIGIVGAWRIGNLLRHTVTSNVPSVIAAEELEISLLLENRAVRAFVTDPGNREWLEELREAIKEFDHWWAEAQRTSHTPEEDAILNRLAAVHQQYATKRDAIVEAYRGGAVERSKDAVLREFHDLYQQCYRLCEEYLAANQRFVAAAATTAHDRVRQLTWLILACLVLTITSGLLLLALVVRGVLGPLRQMVSEARLMVPIDVAAGAQHDGDELRAVGAHLRALMSNVEDIRSSLEQHRERLVESEKKLASVGKLAASVAHEIRNPLAAITLCLRLIRKAATPNVEVERRIGMAEEEIARLDGIIKSFLEFSRPPVLRLCRQDIGPLLDKTFELVGPLVEQKHLRLRREERGGRSWVLVDSDQLKQVMLNLVKNAIEATPESGEVRISTDVIEADGRTSVVVRIANTGPRISDEAQARIFEPFFTTKAEGTGLGLCIAARIMALHGGRLVLESTSDSGTTFAMVLPTARDNEGECSPAGM